MPEIILIQTLSTENFLAILRFSREQEPLLSSSTIMEKNDGTIKLRPIYSSTYSPEETVGSISNIEFVVLVCL